MPHLHRLKYVASTSPQPQHYSLAFSIFSSCPPLQHVKTQSNFHAVSVRTNSGHLLVIAVRAIETSGGKLFLMFTKERNFHDSYFSKNIRHH